ncbi:DUF882 domain-containing protein [Shigella boydii]
MIRRVVSPARVVRHAQTGATHFRLSFIDTNNQLRARRRGVAKKAITLKAGDGLPYEGIALSNIRKTALSLRAGGVGYYPRSNFVHTHRASTALSDRLTKQGQYGLSYYSGHRIFPELFINLV